MLINKDEEKEACAISQSNVPHIEACTALIPLFEKVLLPLQRKSNKPAKLISALMAFDKRRHSLERV